MLSKNIYMYTTLSLDFITNPSSLVVKELNACQMLFVTFLSKTDILLHRKYATHDTGYTNTH